MNYYIIIAKKDACSTFGKIFVDNNYQPIAYILCGASTIRLCSGPHWPWKLSVLDSMSKRNFYNPPRTLTDNEYIELFNILL